MPMVHLPRSSKPIVPHLKKPIPMVPWLREPKAIAYRSIERKPIGVNVENPCLWRLSQESFGI